MAQKPICADTRALIDKHVAVATANADKARKALLKTIISQVKVMHTQRATDAKAAGNKEAAKHVTDFGNALVHQLKEVHLKEAVA